MKIITCPNCKLRVIPKADGTCPNCRLEIKTNKKKATQTKPNSTRGIKNEDKTDTYKEIDWGSVAWKRIYKENRPHVWDRWMVGAVILVGFSLYSLISKRPLTIFIGGIIEIKNQYIPIMVLLTGIFIIAYKIGTTLVGKRLVIHGRIIEKSIDKEKDGQNYYFLIDIKQEFNLNAKGEIGSFNILENCHKILL